MPLTLPPEIWSQIITYFLPPEYGTSWEPQKPWKDRKSIAKYATLSRQWQISIERLTFANVFLTNTRIEEARTILTPARLRFVRELELEVLLDPYDDLARGLTETKIEKSRNNEVFTQTIRSFLRMMNLVETNVQERTGHIKLRLYAYSPSDQRFSSRFRNLSTPEDIKGARYNQSYLELLDSALPEVNSIGRFHVNDPINSRLCRFLNPKACCVIASKFPKLELIHWKLVDNEKKDIQLRSQLRRAFAESLQELPESLQEMTLEYEYESPTNHSRSPGNLQSSENEPDPLSNALRLLFQRLCKVTIYASLTPDVFWPSAGSPPGNEPQFLNLSNIMLILSPATPNGNWLLDRYFSLTENDGDGEDDDEQIEEGPGAPAEEDRIENRFRGSPNSENILPWVIAAGRAAAHMPALDMLNFSTSMATRSYNGVFDLTYRAKKGFLDTMSTPVFELGENATEIWKQASEAAAHGGLAMMHYGPEIQN